ncbi:MAG: hypothetical protein C0478_06225 [Planctomyces sp.]|nr:hypothetical protein [Planctomyces sp.]
MDVIIPKDNAYDRLRILRSAQLELEDGLSGWFASPEDVIVKKLQFFQEGRSEKHLRDIASMLLIREQLIDRDYISRWASQFGVAAEWEVVLARVNNSAEGPHV